MAKKKTLRRIEKTLNAVCAEVGTLRSEVASLRSGAPAAADGATREETIHFLDLFRAGEALGEASLGAWIAASDVACVKGGLRTVQQREGFHARLLEARVKELGGVCQAEVPADQFEAAMKQAADTTLGDAKKVHDFISRFPDCDAALQPIHDLADRLDADPETQTLLRTIAQDERSTLQWFHEACQQLNG